MNDSVVAIVGAFFIMGITVGIITVVAMSAVRADRAYRPSQPGNLSGPLEYGPRGPGRQRPGPDWDDAGPNDTPRWPGDVDSDWNNG